MNESVFHNLVQIVQVRFTINSSKIFSNLTLNIKYPRNLLRSYQYLNGDNKSKYNPKSQEINHFFEVCDKKNKWTSLSHTSDLCTRTNTSCLFLSIWQALIIHGNDSASISIEVLYSSNLTKFRWVQILRMNWPRCLTISFNPSIWMTEKKT